MCPSLVPLGILAAALPLAGAGADRAAEREEMVRVQMEQRGIRDRAVLGALRSVPRELFIPVELRGQAYEDHPVPIGQGQTISQPYIVAVMTEMLAAERGSKVLEIGTGSGYQAAVLSLIAGHVYSIEIIPELARRATATLDRLGYRNVTVRLGDGYKGWPEEAPFDRIILTAAPPRVPQALIDQLKPGGRLVAPEGATPFDQELVVISKDASGRVSRKAVLDVRFVPMVRSEQR